jgi:hypothetical protein
MRGDEQVRGAEGRVPLWPTQNRAISAASSEPLPHSNGQDLVRPSFYQPLGQHKAPLRGAGVRVRAHRLRVAPGDDRIGRIDVGFRSGYRFSQVIPGFIKS